ncbi:TonB family protein [Sphingomonas prati]|uniref:TonB family protein n=1 Tax=Sphingomonas prati TaxID=1843237 RepID=A0A7W9F1G3_9SPHN|nr:TonB family protein [Sphingomonas prati]MBB5727744.1 TonB family protein [Sphingomonas prati]GGE80382.1 hypothetical protein GCM10011404_11360 [Sphingomonas prati]
MQFTALILLLATTAAAVQPAPTPAVRSAPPAADFTVPTQGPPTDLSQHVAGWRYGEAPKTRRTEDVVSFVPGTVRCGTEMVAPDRVVRPYDTSTVRYAQPSVPPPGTTQPGYVWPPATNPRMFEFTIDAAGRPTAIRQRPGPGEYGMFVDTSDLAPALSGWRFRPGAARTGCSIGFTVQAVPIDRAPAASLARLLSGPMIGSAGKAAFDRLKPVGSNCYEGGRPNARSTNFPSFERFVEPNGDWNFSYFQHDIDAAGHPAKIRLIASSGNNGFDAAARAALALNRYQPGARTGCLFQYHTNSAPMQPAQRPAVPVATKGPECPVDLQQVMTLPPGRPFPTPFARRRIGGVATVRFDVASWGQTGNVQVVAAEPADAFGETARSMIQRATVAPSPNGYRGCVTTVRFALPGQRTAAEEDEAQAPG